MASIRFKISALYHSLRNTIIDWAILCKGQSLEYEILQIAHRLEKGLIIHNPRRMWGWEKAERLHYLLQFCDDEFARSTGDSVLSAYLNSKKNSIYEEDIDSYHAFIARTNFKIDLNNLGGALTVEKTTFSNEELNVITKLFTTRHSTRSFSDSTVPMDKLTLAINLALRCPSACNRQPFKVYVVNKDDKQLYISGNIEQEGDMFLYITGSIDAYTLDEINDWIVSPSIFCGYLSLTLHAFGIGSCIIRKDLAKDTDYNKSVKRFCKIPQGEKLIIELAIGLYDDTFTVPVSNRKTANDSMIICSEQNIR